MIYGSKDSLQWRSDLPRVIFGEPEPVSDWCRGGAKFSQITVTSYLSIERGRGEGWCVHCTLYTALHKTVQQLTLADFS